MLLEYVKLSLGQIWAHKLRSFLTVLSITIGAGSIVAMTSLAQSGLATLTRGIEEVGGTRFISVFADEPKKAKDKRGNYAKRLTLGDRDALSAALPDLESIVASINFYNSPVAAGDRPAVMTSVLATEPNYFGAYKMKVGVGRQLTDADRDYRGRVAVIGDELREKLFGKGGEAIGREVRFRGDRFRVVGVLSANQKGDSINLGYDWDTVMIVPITAPGMGTDVEQISMTVRETEQGDHAIRVANAVLLHRHNGVDDFQIFDFGGLLKNFYAAFAVMRLVVGAIASIALIIGGVGVMNIMLVAVQERMREIGLRKALGATAATIRNQFLMEAVALTLVGAAVGVAGGSAVAWGGSQLIKAMNPAWVPTFSMGSVMVALAASSAVGLFFGWFPAMRAAESEPIACLRHE